MGDGRGHPEKCFREACCRIGILVKLDLGRDRPIQSWKLGTTWVGWLLRHSSPPAWGHTWLCFLFTLSLHCMQMAFNYALRFRRWAQLNCSGGTLCSRVPIASSFGWMNSRKAWFDPSIVMHHRLAPDRIAEMQMHWFALQTYFGLSCSCPTGRI